MIQPRRNRRVDTNQAQIVKALRKLPGITVKTDVDDILVGYSMMNFLFEIKRPELMRKDGTVRPSAKRPSQWHMEKNWTGQYNIVATVEEILDVIGYRHAD